MFDVFVRLAPVCPYIANPPVCVCVCVYSKGGGVSLWCCLVATFLADRSDQKVMTAHDCQTACQ